MTNKEDQQSSMWMIQETKHAELKVHKTDELLFIWYNYYWSICFGWSNKHYSKFETRSSIAIIHIDTWRGFSLVLFPSWLESKLCINYPITFILSNDKPKRKILNWWGKKTKQWSLRWILYPGYGVVYIISMANILFCVFWWHRWRR